MRQTLFLVGISILLCLFSNTFSYSQAAYKSETDSLKLTIEKASGEKKLELTQRLYLIQADTKNAKELSKDLIEEALKQKNLTYLINGYNFLSKSYFYENNIDSLFHCVKQIEEIKKDVEQSDAYAYLTHLYINRGYYELAIRNLNRMLKKAGEDRRKEANINMLLSVTYSSCGKYDLAEECSLRSLELIYIYFPTTDPSNVGGIYESSVAALVFNKNLDKALEVCSEFEKRIEEHSNSNNQYYVYRFINYNMFVTIYNRFGQVQKAKTYIDRMNEIPTGELFESLLYVKDGQWAKYYNLTGNTKLALMYVDKALTYFSSAGNRLLITQLEELKIEILESQGKYKEALIIQKNLANYQDSIAQINIPLQLEQQAKEYELEKAKLYQENAKVQKQKSQSIIGGLCMALLLLSAIIYITKCNAKSVKEKNKILYKQYESLLQKYQKEDIEDAEDIAINDNTSLFIKIDTYVQENSLYKKSDITREDLSKLLNTNRQYLTEAIKDGTGKTFLEYINNYRLHYVHRKLIQDLAAPVNTVAFEAGFSSMPTFYRLFKKEFGMSPGELRETKVLLSN